MPVSPSVGTTEALVRTRHAWHAVAELLVAGPVHRATSRLALQVVPGGFGSPITRVHVAGTDLALRGRRIPLVGTVRTVGAAAGIEPVRPDVYPRTGTDPDAPLEVDAASAATLAAWFAAGETALRAVWPDAEPLLWPEHFDLAVATDEATYGVSPGDDEHPTPYAYVSTDRPVDRRDGYWNVPFGALRDASTLHETGALRVFLAAGRRRLHRDVRPGASGS